MLRASCLRWAVIGGVVVAALGAPLTACASALPMPNTVSIQPALTVLLEDAARRSGLPVARLRVLAIEAVVWRDGALGCPQPGRLYPQVLVPGYRVRIAEVDGAHAFDYHVGERGGWTHCPPERAQEPLPRGADPRI
jgi:hypothetical protein